MMPLLDRAYKNTKECLKTFIDISKELGKFILNTLIAIIIYGTLPIWILPYLIIKKKKVIQNDRY